MLEKGEIFLGEFYILNNLGEGGMGKVYLAEHVKDRQRYAIKEQKITDKNLNFIMSEIRIQEKLKHAALPEIKYVHETATHVYIVMDYIQGKTLEALLNESGRFVETRVISWAVQICDILRYLHSRQQPIVYRDLKPSNIMIDEKDQVHLIDFGIAQEYENIEYTNKRAMALTRGYAAPEQYDSKYRSDVRTDIYALGVTMHYLLTGKNPLKPPYHFERVRKLKNDISYAMEEIVRKCLQPNPDERYESADSLYGQLTHMEELEKKLAKKRRAKRWIISIVSLVTVAVLCGVYFAVGQKRSSRISEYYETLSEAEQKMQDKDYESAYRLILESIEYQPEAEEGYLAMARCLKEQQKYEECFGYIQEEILNQFPEIYDKEDFLSLMGELYMGAGQSQQAEYYWEELCRKDKENVEYLYQLTVCYIESDKLEEAEEIMEQMRQYDADRIMMEELENRRDKK